jgi:hypothetical protein
MYEGNAHFQAPVQLSRGRGRISTYSRKNRITRKRADPQIVMDVALDTVLSRTVWFTQAEIIANLSSSTRVFEFVHAREIKKVKDDGTWTGAQLETIVHPNEYFKRGYLLKNLGKAPASGAEGDVVVKGEVMEE